MKVYLLFIVMLFFSSCMDRIDLRKFEVSNNSNANIYTVIHDNNIEDGTTNNYGFIGDFTDSIYNHKVKEINRSIDWKTYISRSMGHKFRFYIIEKDSVDKYGWKEIQRRNIYNKKYLLDMDVLDSLNWKIEYNGD